MKYHQKALIILLLFTSLILILSPLAWLSVVFLVSTLIFWIGYSDYHTVALLRNKKWISYPLFFIIIVFFSIGIKLFIIEIYAIPSVSMEDTLLPGDKIIMSKLSYGPRSPSSPFEIPWINIAFYMNKESRSKVDSVWWKHKRLKGFSKIKHNDIVVFVSTKNHEETLIKRCLGLPGDTLLIRNEKVFANNSEISEEGTFKFIQRILFNNYAKASSLLDSMGLKEYPNGTIQKNFFSTPLNNNQKSTLLANKCIDSIVLETSRYDSAYVTFPYNSLFPWSVDNFGPLIIPSSGMNIQLNDQNYILYSNLISKYENSNIELREDNYFLNGLQITSYTFISNYYFMLGDNRHDSNDSRYWGFVPENNILGKAVLVIFSKGEDGFRWERLFKGIN